VKFDFFGLATLTILELAKDYIIARHPDQKDFDFARRSRWTMRPIPAASEGKTVAVFQFESRGMQRHAEDAKPTASRTSSRWWRCTARADGPDPEFCARKHGREEIDYPIRASNRSSKRPTASWSTRSR
jgi:DNA polymerase-3 subunit alpha